MKGNSPKNLMNAFEKECDMLKKKKKNNFFPLTGQQLTKWLIFGLGKQRIK